MPVEVVRVRGEMGGSGTTRGTSAGAEVALVSAGGDAGAGPGESGMPGLASGERGACCCCCCSLGAATGGDGWAIE